MKQNEFRFESLEVYQKAFSFARRVYLLSQLWPKEHLYNLGDQLRRAALSIPLNIAEGSSRTKNDFRHFLIIARGSCFECVPLIKLTASLKLIGAEEESLLYNEAIGLSQMLSKLRSVLGTK